MNKTVEEIYNFMSEIGIDPDYQANFERLFLFIHGRDMDESEIILYRDLQYEESSYSY